MPDHRNYIVKNSTLPIAQDMEALKAKGIELAKQFSGDIWTDYNEHDPGVTVLENLCYAIMEMSYKANFDFEQLFFANGDLEHTLKLEDYFLLKQEEVFYTNPITILDYRKLLLDRLSENVIKNLWVEKSATSNGHYNIYVQLQKKEAIKEKIQELYDEYRNFGEQCGEIVILEHKAIQNQIGIAKTQLQQLSMDVIAASIAQFIHDIKIYVEPPIRYAKSIQRLELEEEQLEEVLQGPKPKKKFIHPDHLALTSLEKMKKEIDLAAFIKRNAAKWNNLITFEDKEALKFARFDESAKTITIFNEEDFINKLEEAAFPEKIRTAYQVKSIKPLLNGEVEWETYQPQSNLLKEDLADYYSIQYTFPQNYNLGLDNVSMLSLPQQQQIKNLQNYLLLFESLLVDFLVKLISFPELLKIGGKLENGAIETQFLNILKKIPASAIESEEDLKKIYTHFSFNQAQQIQVREYALARYGETFDIELLKKAWGEPNNFEEDWLERLNQLMKTYKTYGQGRHNSFDLSKSDTDFPLSQKLSILLNQDYNVKAPNVYVIESSLVPENKNENPFVVSIIIDLPLDLKDYTQKLSKRQKAIIRLIKEELPFHLTYNGFWFLSEKGEKDSISKIEKFLEAKNEDQVNYLDKSQFKKVYRDWREKLA